MVWEGTTGWRNSQGTRSLQMNSKSIHGKAVIYPLPDVNLRLLFRLDCTLRELMSLIREVNPETRQKGTLFSFSTVYPDPRRGGFRIKDLGQTCSGRKGSDDEITLYSRKFQIGDYMDVAISNRPSRGRPY